MAELEPITTILPPDITLYHILPRLPGKYVARFTRISKQWHSFIRTHGFRKIHLHHVINNDHQNHQKLLLLPHNRPWDFQTIDCETPEDGITVSRPLPFKVRSGKKISIVASLHGMTEKLRDIETPHFGNRWTDCMNFMVAKDCIHFRVAFINSTHRYDTIEQWRTDGDGHWTKVETSSTKEQLSYYHKPEHLMRKGNWLMYSSSGDHVYVLDAKKHTKRIMYSVGIAFSPVGKYMETLMSPNQYLK
ncbi:hypothetical protein L2E82_03525 [Cichorium intybus]|uniref:Uncharacterized protein n=1 Tax=Cichorium intybus TaxID=13427 RepID=A0ACB9H5C1_CICIN|nr:hypothetical protein L2E82_03525 [Cichorium intybus]